jgi:hypothetical protein
VGAVRGCSLFDGLGHGGGCFLFFHLVCHRIEVAEGLRSQAALKE